MGRSAKLMKRPTQKQKAASKIAKAASKPVPTPVVVKKTAAVEEEEEGVKGGKKRKMMRVKVDQKLGKA